MERSASMDIALAADDPEAAATAAGLVYVTDTDPGYKRLRREGRFVYVDKRGRTVKEPAELQRIARLAVLPAYEDVWVCANPRGHLQATGRDARGRKQYRYHPRWRAVRDDTKFERMQAFGLALPRLRRRVARDLALPGLPRDKVIALIVSLLDRTRLRVGNTVYAQQNNSFGLTTLRSRHVRFSGSRALLRFRGKGGVEHEVSLDDARVVRIMRGCHQLPGQQLFQYVDSAGERHAVGSEQVNAYLHEAMGEAFTAKDFRTWGATLRAIELMSAVCLPESGGEKAVAGCINEVVRQVAAELRNTPAVCRKAYINPAVFQAWRQGLLTPKSKTGAKGHRQDTERMALAFLRRSEKALSLESALRRSHARLNKRPKGPPARTEASTAA